MNDSAELKVGSEVRGSYEIVEVLGRGATGMVYRARAGRGDIVALKVLHVNLVEDAELRSRFEREALVTSRIDHPGCVSVFDIGTLDDGSLFLVMEYVEGESLATLLQRKGTVPPQRALEIAGDVLGALERAHAAEVIHRDIKPRNILLGASGAKLLDFGLARLIGDAAIGSEKLTRAGMAVGTPTYMAPEWLTTGELDIRADLYAVSVVLFEMLTGAPPFSGNEPLEILERHATEPVPEMNGVPDEVARLVRRGLAKNRDTRLTTAGDYLRALETAAYAIEKRTLLMTAIPAADGLENQPTTAVCAASAADGLESQPTTVVRAATAESLPPLPRPRQTPVWPSERVRDVIAAAVQRIRRSPRRSLMIAAGVGLMLWITTVAASDGDDRAVFSGANYAALESWRAGGLDAGGFAAFDGRRLAAISCQVGAVNGLEVTVCRYPDAAAAVAAEPRGRRTIGAYPGAAVAVANQLLVVADRRAVDPSGRTINRVINRFRDATR